MLRVKMWFRAPSTRKDLSWLLTVHKSRANSLVVSYISCVMSKHYTDNSATLTHLLLSPRFHYKETKMQHYHIFTLARCSHFNLG